MRSGPCGVPSRLCGIPCFEVRKLTRPNAQERMFYGIKKPRLK
jgi:hypothetical protein